MEPEAMEPEAIELLEIKFSGKQSFTKPALNYSIASGLNYSLTSGFNPVLLKLTRILRIQEFPVVDDILIHFQPLQIIL
jgi:hypothetical protein